MASDPDDPLRSTFQDAKAISERPGAPNKLGKLIDVVAQLGNRNLDVLAELKSTNRLVRGGIGIGILLTGAFLYGASLINAGVKELQTAREADREALAQQITNAKTELEDAVKLAEEAGDRATVQAKQATAEGVEAQVEAAEVQVRFLNAKERRAVRKKIDKKRAKAQQLRDLK